MTVVPKRAYTLEFKLSVVEWVESNQQSYRAAARQFGLDRKIIRTWVGRKASLVSALATHGPKRKKVHRGRAPISEHMEQQVLEFQLESRRRGSRVLDRDLQAKALECAQKLGLADFKASGVWLKGWKHRHGVVFQNGSNEVASLSQLSGMASAPPLPEPRCPWMLSSCDPNGVSEAESESSRRLCETDRSSPALPGAVRLDYAAPEHSYSQPTDLSDTNAASQSDPTVNPSESRLSPTGSMRDQTDFGLPPTHFGPSHLGSTRLSPTHLSPTYLHPSSQPSLLDPDSGQADPTLFDALGIVGEVSELELPLGHEEVAGEEVWLSPPKKSKRGRSRGKGGVKRSPTPVATFGCLDDPHGPGGLLASRLSQPVFHLVPRSCTLKHLPSSPTSKTSH